MEEKFFQLKIRPFKACLNFPFLYVLFEAVFTLSVSIDAFGSVQNPFDFYRPQRSCGKVMFLHLSVILSMAGGLAGRHPLADRHPLPPPPAGRQPLGRPLQRTIRILLECIFVDTMLLLTLTLCVNVAFETNVFLPSKYVSVSVNIHLEMVPENKY